MPQTQDAVWEIADIAQNADHLTWLADQIRKGSVTPFVGAGMSMGFGFMGWSAFLLKTAVEFGASEKVPTLLQARNYESAAQVCLEARDPESFNDRLRGAYGDDKLPRSPKGAVSLLPK